MHSILFSQCLRIFVSALENESEIDFDGVNKNMDILGYLLAVGALSERGTTLPDVSLTSLPFPLLA